MEGFSARSHSDAYSVSTRLTGQDLPLRSPRRRFVGLLVLFIFNFILVFIVSPPARAETTFRVATYNLENYLLAEHDGRPAKPVAARAKIRETIRALNADVLALQEIGGAAALEELRSSLASEGCRYDHWELVNGHDPHISVALLSRFPIVARRPHPRESFLLLGRRHFVSRGFLEVDLQPAPGYQLTLFSAHLKSRRAVLEADEAELREQESRLLREKVEARLALDPKVNLVVLGDFNDTKDSKTIKTLVGKGNLGLIDTRPRERVSRDPMSDPLDGESRAVTWTHYYGKEDTYSRIDYLLISRGLYHEWIREQTEILARPDWGAASDHRPLVAVFRTDDRGIVPTARKRSVKRKEP